MQVLFRAECTNQNFTEETDKAILFGMALIILYLDDIRIHSVKN